MLHAHAFVFCTLGESLKVQVDIELPGIENEGLQNKSFVGLAFPVF